MFESVLKMYSDLEPAKLQKVKDNVSFWEDFYFELAWDLKNKNNGFKDDSVFLGPWREMGENKYDYMSILANQIYNPTETALILEGCLRIADGLNKKSVALHEVAISKKIKARREIAETDDTVTDSEKVRLASIYFSNTLKTILMPAIERGMLENNLLAEGKDNIVIYKTEYYEKSNKFSIDSLTDDSIQFLELLTLRLANLSQISFYSSSTAFETVTPVITDVAKYEDFWVEALDLIWETRTLDILEREDICNVLIEKIITLIDTSAMNDLYVDLFNQIKENKKPTEVGESETSEEKETDLGDETDEEAEDHKPNSMAIRLDKDTYKNTKAMSKVDANELKKLEETTTNVTSKWDLEQSTGDKHIQILEEQKDLEYTTSNIHSGVSITAKNFYSNKSESTYSGTGKLIKKDMSVVKKLSRDIYKTFQKLFYDKEKRKIMTGLEHGSFNGNESYRLFTDQRVFLKKQPKPKRNDLGFYILIDESGSMGTGKGSTLYYTMMAAYAIASCCEKLKIPVGVMGHNTGYSDVKLNLYKSMNKKGSVNNILCADCGGANRDGLALFKAVELFHKECKNRDKILFIISDGQPADNGYYGCSAEKDIISVVKYAKKQYGINVIGVGVGESAEYVKNIYPDWIYASEPEELGLKLGQKVKDMLLKTR